MKIISGKQMCRVLEQRGWTLARVRGSHHIYRHSETGRRTVVPVHSNQDLKPGTQRGIMRDAGLAEDDLCCDPQQVPSLSPNTKISSRLTRREALRREGRDRHSRGRSAAAPCSVVLVTSIV